MPLSLGLRLGLSASTSTLGWVPTVESSPAAVAFNGQQFALPAYGSELVTNGTFDTDVSSWPAQGSGDVTISWVSGTMQLTRGAGGTNGRPAQSISLTPGKLYEFRFTAGALGVACTLNSGSSSDNVYLSTAVFSSGANTRYFTAATTTANISFWPINTSTSTTVDNVSVREVMLGEMGTNLGASGYTMSVAGGTATATESPTGTLNLTGDGTNFARGTKQITGLTVGAHYRIVYLCSGNFPSIFVGTTSAGLDTFNLTVATGLNVHEFTATATTHWLTFNKVSTGLASISSITIAQWTPRPTLRTVSAANAIGVNGEVIVLTGSSTTAKTYVGADGLIKNDLAADVPRWDFSNGKARLLLENASTNLLLRSAEFDNASWTAINLTITANATTSPDGTQNADLLYNNTVSANHVRARQSITSTISTSYTTSCYFKNDNAQYAHIIINDGSDYTAIFNLATGEITSTSAGITSTITSVGNGWYRCTVTRVASTTSLFVILGPSGSGGVSVNTGLGVFAYGAQLEAASFASSYIPTTTATVTRTIETARFSPLVEAIFQLPGATARVQAATLSSTTGMRLIGQQTAGTNPGLVFINSASQLGSWNGSASITATLGSGAPTTGVGGAVSFNSSGRTLAANGGSVGSDTNGIGTRTAFYLGRGETVTSPQEPANGYYNSFALWPFRVSNANLPAIAVAPT